MCERITFIHYADLAHLVERNLAKVEVAGSSPVIRLKRVSYDARFLLFVDMLSGKNMSEEGMRVIEIRYVTAAVL